MRTLMVVLAVCVAVATSASAGSGCGKAEKKAAENKSCSYKSAKAGDCKGCSAVHKGSTGMKAAGATVEVVETKKGYIVMATTDKSDSVESVRTANADWIKGLGAADKGCENCTAFAKAVDAGEISVEEVNVANGVMTVYTATTDSARKTLGNCCSMIKS